LPSPGDCPEPAGRFLFRCTLENEIGDLRRPGKSRKWAVRAQTSKANDFAVRIFGYEERIALGQIQEGLEELVGNLALGIGVETALHVVAGAREDAGAARWYKTQPYVIALYTGTSTPMVQNGQELGEDHWLPEDDEGTGRRVTPRPIRWKYANDTIGTILCKLYGRMTELRKNYPVLCRGSFDPDYWKEWQTQFKPAGYGLDAKRQLAV
jgi:hypothetical protein